MSDLARDGFAVLHGFLDPAAVRAIRAKVDSLARVPAPAGCERPHNTLRPPRWSDAILEMALSSPRRRAALAHALRARDLRWISAYVSSKDARSPALWWIKTGGAGSTRLPGGVRPRRPHRLLHGTHPNASRARRDCVVLLFAPTWSNLPADVRAHLICHPAQPARDEVAGLPWQAGLLPRFDGTRRDLALSRDAPARFAIPDANDVAGAAMDTRG